MISEGSIGPSSSTRLSPGEIFGTEDSASRKLEQPVAADYSCSEGDDTPSATTEVSTRRATESVLNRCIASWLPSSGRF